jgi:hypothetical protein
MVRFVAHRPQVTPRPLGGSGTVLHPRMSEGGLTTAPTSRVRAERRVCAYVVRSSTGGGGNTCQVASSAYSQRYRGVCSLGRFQGGDSKGLSAPLSWEVRSMDNPTVRRVARSRGVS